MPRCRESARQPPGTTSAKSESASAMKRMTRPSDTLVTQFQLGFARQQWCASIASLTRKACLLAIRSAAGSQGARHRRARHPPDPKSRSPSDVLFRYIWLLLLLLRPAYVSGDVTARCGEDPTAGRGSRETPVLKTRQPQNSSSGAQPVSSSAGVFGRLARRRVRSPMTLGYCVEERPTRRASEGRKRLSSTKRE